MSCWFCMLSLATLYNILIILPCQRCRELYMILTGQATTNANSRYALPYHGRDRHWKRYPSDAEDYLLKKALLDPRLEGRWFSRLVGDQFNRFKTWPMFFDSVESSGKELGDGFANVWSTFILAGTLLATVALQPFLASETRKGWRFGVYGTLWTVATLSDFAGLVVTTIFFSFLRTIPAELTYMWVCNIGAWIAVPTALLILGTLATVVATTYSAFIIYGNVVGAISAFGFVLITKFSVNAANALGNASVATEALLNKP